MTGKGEREGDTVEETRRRVETWRRTGDLGALWPDVPAATVRRSHRRLRELTEGMLRGGTASSPLEAADDLESRALGIAGFTSGMGPLVGWWIEQGRVDASARVAGLFEAHLAHGRRRGRSLRENLRRAVRAMRAEDVDPIVLKGLHTGAVHFPEPGVRPAADIDLLVRPEERTRAAAGLERAGFVERRATRFAGRSEWTPADAPTEIRSLEVDHALNPWSVDLHVALDRWYFRGMKRGLGEPFDETTGIAIDDVTCRGLAEPHLTAFLALHASYEVVKVRLVRLVELILVMRHGRATGVLDWDELAALLEETRTARFVHPALSLAEGLAPGTVDPDLLARTALEASPRARRVTAAVLSADLAPLARPSLDAKMMWSKGPREVLLNLSELLVPSDDGLPVGLGRLQWRRLMAIVRRKAGLRAEPRAARPSRSTGS